MVYRMVYAKVEEGVLPAEQDVEIHEYTEEEDEVEEGCTQMMDLEKPSHVAEDGPHSVP